MKKPIRIILGSLIILFSLILGRWTVGAIFKVQSLVAQIAGEECHFSRFGNCSYSVIPDNLSSWGDYSSPYWCCRAAAECLEKMGTSGASAVPVMLSKFKDGFGAPDKLLIACPGETAKALGALGDPSALTLLKRLSLYPAPDVQKIVADAEERLRKTPLEQ